MSYLLVDENDEGDITHVRDEALSKNPIRDRRQTDRVDLPQERLIAALSGGRDFFHSFVNVTLGRRYKRPPIYLVDDYVIDALGRFNPNQQIAVGHGPIPAHRFAELSRPIEWMKPTVVLFERLDAARKLLNQAGLLRVGPVVERLSLHCAAIIQKQHVLEELSHDANQVGELIDRATRALERDIFVGHHVEPTLARSVRDALRALVQAAEVAFHTQPQSLPGTGFAPGRPGGFMFGSIPDLDIEGPAILLAPKAIADWAAEFSGLRAVASGVAPDSMDAWFGVRDARHRPLALALVNVLHHEMVHAMVALPTDPVQNADELMSQRLRFYVQHREFEEGLCDATAAISTGVMLFKAKFNIKGKDLPRLGEGRYRDEWNAFRPVIESTYWDYHGPATNMWLQGWDNNKRDFKAFAGVVGLYATNFSGLDWMQTFHEFEQGRITTGGHQ